jgi:DNA-binding transcriptional ArsR family regulator
VSSEEVTDLINDLQARDQIESAELHRLSALIIRSSAESGFPYVRDQICRFVTSELAMRLERKPDDIDDPINYRHLFDLLEKLIVLDNYSQGSSSFVICWI